MIRIPVIQSSTGVYLRWYFNGWHYFNFQNNYEVVQNTEVSDIHVSEMFSRISKIEKPTKIRTTESYSITIDGIKQGNIQGFKGLILAEKVERYETTWNEVFITRSSFTIKEGDSPAYSLSFEITSKEDYYNTTYLYVGDTLCDLDDEEIIAINKQVNDIAEMQDRQSDFTQQFKIKRTREMRLLFDRSGETSSGTDFPYQNQSCKVIQDGIEIISFGNLILDNVDSDYYYVSVYSGNINFFKAIENKTLNDLTLASTDHTWNLTNAVLSHTGAYDYMYPLVEASNDGAMCSETDTGTTLDLYTGWIWPFVRVSKILSEIFSNAGYLVEGDFLTDKKYLGLWMPIQSLNITKERSDKYLTATQSHIDKINYYSGRNKIKVVTMWAYPMPISSYFEYTTPVIATYKIRVYVYGSSDPVNLFLYYDGIDSGQTFTKNEDLTSTGIYVYDISYASAQNRVLSVWVPAGFWGFKASVFEITDAKIGFGSAVTPALHLPALSQTEFIKIICNMFGLIPDANARDKKVKFWNYLDLYNNIAIARDWSQYLSEQDDSTEFKFGDYAQNNYLKYKDSEDVKLNQGRGNMLITNETLQNEKDVIELPLSTCDEITVLTDQNVSRIAMNKYNQETGTYDQKDTIEARIVYIDTLYGKTLGLSDGVTVVTPSGTIIDISNPKRANSLEVSFSSLIENYSGLSRLLTKTNLKKAKLNLPVYEVANLKHYIPVYLIWYKAYFYVNKITNYVRGKLVTVELIKL